MQRRDVYILVLLLAVAWPVAIIGSSNIFGGYLARAADAVSRAMPTAPAANWQLISETDRAYVILNSANDRICNIPKGRTYLPYERSGDCLVLPGQPGY